jgi:hypothetical protein
LNFFFISFQLFGKITIITIIIIVRKKNQKTKKNNNYIIYVNVYLHFKYSDYKTNKEEKTKQNWNNKNVITEINE